MRFEGFGQIAEQLRRSTVHISAGQDKYGSGLIVRPEGLIVTNAHVAASRALLVQLWDGSSVQANLLLRDTQRDLAIVRIARSGLPMGVLADSDGLRVGEPVIAIGNPFGFLGALTTGSVHAVGVVPGLGPRKWVQADIRLAPGNSGGPLANAHGRVVGINTMTAGGVGMAIPSNSVARFLGGSDATRARDGGLGVAVRPVDVTLEGKRSMGLLITEITMGRAAGNASLMPGDILVGVENRRLEAMDDFEQALDGEDERVIRLQFLRGDRLRIRSVAVRLGLRYSAAA